MDEIEEHESIIDLQEISDGEYFLMAQIDRGIMVDEILFNRNAAKQIRDWLIEALGEYE